MRPSSILDGKTRPVRSAEFVATSIYDISSFLLPILNSIALPTSVNSSILLEKELAKNLSKDAGGTCNSIDSKFYDDLARIIFECKIRNVVESSDEHSDTKDGDSLDDALDASAYQCHDSEGSEYESAKEEYSEVCENVVNEMHQMHIDNPNDSKQNSDVEPTFPFLRHNLTPLSDKFEKLSTKNDNDDNKEVYGVQNVKVKVPSPNPVTYATDNPNEFENLPEHRKHESEFSPSGNSMRSNLSKLSFIDAKMPYAKESKDGTPIYASNLNTEFETVLNSPGLAHKKSSYGPSFCDQYSKENCGIPKSIPVLATENDDFLSTETFTKLNNNDTSSHYRKVPSIPSTSESNVKTNLFSKPDAQPAGINNLFSPPEHMNEKGSIDESNCANKAGMYPNIDFTSSNKVETHPNIDFTSSNKVKAHPKINFAKESNSSPPLSSTNESPIKAYSFNFSSSNTTQMNFSAMPTTVPKFEIGNCQSLRSKQRKKKNGKNLRKPSTRRTAVPSPPISSSEATKVEELFNFEAFTKKSMPTSPAVISKPRIPTSPLINTNEIHMASTSSIPTFSVNLKVDTKNKDDPKRPSGRRIKKASRSFGKIASNNTTTANFPFSTSIDSKPLSDEIMTDADVDASPLRDFQGNSVLRDKAVNISTSSGKSFKTVGKSAVQSHTNKISNTQNKCPPLNAESTFHFDHLNSDSKKDKNSKNHDLLNKIGTQDHERRERFGKSGALKETAKVFYLQKRYQKSVIYYTDAIKAHTINFTRFPDPMEDREDGELLSSLYGNRAAALMMIGIYDAAAFSCRKATEYIISYRVGTESIISLLKPDGGLPLKAKLFARMGRAYLRLGMIVDAEEAYTNATKLVQLGLNYLVEIHSIAPMTMNFKNQKQAQEILKQCKSDSSFQKIEIDNLKKILNELDNYKKLLGNTYDRQVLKCIDTALKISPGSIEFQRYKILRLVRMKKWTRVANFCEEIACNNVESDSVFTKDLKKHNPFPSVPVARFLKNDRVTNENNAVLTTEEVEEAVLRIPYELLQHYLRALRLDERYSRANMACDTLVSFFHPAHSYKGYYWLSAERDKLRRTVIEKEKGDTYYRNGLYQQSADKYAITLTIDDGIKSAGGRLHAVLHCNRAACFMALRKFSGAAKECNAALIIEPYYMKAILRRARCNMKMKNLDASIIDYKKWVKLVRNSTSKEKPNSFREEECHFDRSSDVAEADLQNVRKELLEVESKRIDEKNKEYQAKKTSEYQKSRNNNSRSSSKNRRSASNNNEYEPRSPRWDSFNGSGPKKSGCEKKQKAKHRGSNKSQEPNSGSPGCATIQCHYKVLQVQNNASINDIKKAYHKMALRYHPDKNNSTSASDTFRKVKLAYEILSDVTRRTTYDFECQMRQYH